MKVVNYNSDGIRSAKSRRLLFWLQAIDADTVCFQEIKVQQEKIPIMDVEMP